MSLLKNTEIEAEPRGLQIMGNFNDRRHPSNLLSPPGVTNEAREIWMAPFINPKVDDPALNFNLSLNQVFLKLANPAKIACIKLWNYSRDWKRGVREFELYLDGNMIFEGVLRPAKSAESAQTSLIFTSGQMVLDKL